MQRVKNDELMLDSLMSTTARHLTQQCVLEELGLLHEHRRRTPAATHICDRKQNGVPAAPRHELYHDEHAVRVPNPSPAALRGTITVSHALRRSAAPLPDRAIRVAPRGDDVANSSAHSARPGTPESWEGVSAQLPALVQLRSSKADVPALCFGYSVDAASTLPVDSYASTSKGHKNVKRWQDRSWLVFLTGCVHYISSRITARVYSVVSKALLIHQQYVSGGAYALLCELAPHSWCAGTTS